MSAGQDRLRDRLRAAVLALPLIGLAAAWAVSHQRGQQGVVWEVPVQGYDPRDLLRGHYLVFQYDWPGLDDEDVPGPGATLCIEGDAPRIAATRLKRGDDQRCAHPVRAALGDTLLAGRLYIPQEKARDLETKLADPALRGIVRLRIREDGRYTPIDIRFEAQSAGPPTEEDGDG